MICLECSLLDLRTYRDHAKVGLGKCGVVKMPGVFVSFSRRRDCQSMKPADDETVNQRLEWWDNRKR